MLELYDLKTEYRTDPVGLDTTRPRFSWKLRSDRRGVVQTSYRICAVSREEVLWDSGEVESGQSQQVRYAGKPLESRQRVEWQVSVTAVDKTGAIFTAEWQKARFQMGFLERSDWQAKWAECEDDPDPDARKPALYLRREFTVKPGLKRAVLFQSAHGLYDFVLNGRPGTEDKFLPGLTSYHHRIQYQMYDVTNLLEPGPNCWAVRLADGWWRGVTGGTVHNNFGRKLAFLGQMELEYEDGSTQSIVSDENFHWSTGGLLASDMQMGEIFDAALEPQGWQFPGFDDSAWKNVHPAAEFTGAALISSRSVPVREREIFEGKSFRDTAGALVLDFGQNIAGYVKMTLRDTKPGQEIHLLHGEELVEGAFSQANVRKTTFPMERFQEVVYRCKGDREESYCPAFSVFGFRYVRLEGYDGPIHPGDFTAIAVYSAMEETGDFICSNALIDQLVENSRWSQKGNFLDVAVDCPTRERNAWTGDNQVYVKTAANFMDVYTFYEKWLADQAIEQYASGKVGITFPSTSSVHDHRALETARKNNLLAALAGPEGNGNIGEDAVGWGDSAVWLPYMVYLCYGDTAILEQQYETARGWLEYERSQARRHNPKYEHLPQYRHRGTDGTLDAEYIYDTNFQYGEWNEPIDKTPEEQKALMEMAIRAKAEDKSILQIMAEDGKPEVATAYFYRSACNVAHMACILGKNEDAQRYEVLARRIKEVYCAYLIGPEGLIQPGHQAPYVRALWLGLYQDEVQKKELLAQLIREVVAADFHLNTGFLSTPYLLPVLADNGYVEYAFRILEQTDCPSWLYTVKRGATTIPESWHAIDRHGESLNHYSYGAVCDFLFQYVAGIRPLFNAPGYAQFELHPVPGGSLTHAQATFESLYGTIVSGWERKKGKLLYHCTVPANTTAHLTLPDGSKHTLGSGSYEFTMKESA